MIYISLITDNVKHLFIWFITFVVLFSQKGVFMSFFYWAFGFVGFFKNPFVRVLSVSLVALEVRNATVRDARDVGSIPGSGGSPGNGSWLQYSCLEKFRQKWTEEPGGLQSRGLQSQTRLSD